MICRPIYLSISSRHEFFGRPAIWTQFYDVAATCTDHFHGLFWNHFNVVIIDVFDHTAFDGQKGAQRVIQVTLSIAMLSYAGFTFFNTITKKNVTVPQIGIPSGSPLWSQLVGGQKYCHSD